MRPSVRERINLIKAIAECFRQEGLYCKYSTTGKWLSVRHKSIRFIINHDNGTLKLWYKTKFILAQELSDPQCFKNITQALASYQQSLPVS